MVTIREGDIIVMLSDGITCNTDMSAEDNPWLTELVFANREKCASDLSECILSESLTRFGATDDMSVVVIQVSRC